MWSSPTELTDEKTVVQCPHQQDSVGLGVIQEAGAVPPADSE